MFNILHSSSQISPTHRTNEVRPIRHASTRVAPYAMHQRGLPIRQETTRVAPIRPERAEAPSPGHRPGDLWTQAYRPVRAKAFKYQPTYKAFNIQSFCPYRAPCWLPIYPGRCPGLGASALSGRVEPACHLYFCPFRAYLNHLRKVSSIILKIVFPFLASLRVEENDKRQCKHKHHYIKKQICFHNYYFLFFNKSLALYLCKNT